MDTSRIDAAIRALSRAADRLDRHAVRADDYDYVRDLRQTASEAEKELSALQRELPRMADLKRAADRDYDAHVTRAR